MKYLVVAIAIAVSGCVPALVVGSGVLGYGIAKCPTVDCAEVQGVDSMCCVAKARIVYESE